MMISSESGALELVSEAEWSWPCVSRAGEDISYRRNFMCRLQMYERAWGIWNATAELLWANYSSSLSRSPHL